VSKLSAIVSAYFADKYLPGRIENLQRQSLVPEIIVVCHEDSKEREVIRDFDVKKIIIPANEPIPTIYEAWNMAIKQAEGEYITNANCDDRLYPKALEKLARALDEHPKYSMSYFNVDVVNEIDAAPVSKYEWFEGGLKELVMQGCFLGPMPMWRKSLHDKYGYFEESYKLRNGDIYKPQVVSDFEFWMRLAQGGEQFFHVREILGAYLDHPKSAEKRSPLRRLWEECRAKAKYKAQFEEPLKC